MILTYIIIFSFAGSIGAIAGASILMLLGSKVKMIIPYILSYAIGTLLGAAFLGMLPKAMTMLSPALALKCALIGLLFFFLLEKIVIWRHCHDPQCDVHSATGYLILIGDAFHNFMDGVVIATAFMVSVPLGIGTSLAVIAHEVPQEVGDFAILLDSGMNKWKAFFYNLLSALPTLPGALIAYFSLMQLRQFIPFILVLSASSFIYIAMADLIPATHKNVTWKTVLAELILILAGIGTIGLFHRQSL
ncbi:MAG: ZIP family metal transporter [Thermodesulfobacteriota bacterium]|nr:ZIP family metal transporter [Thermodesulfobacteriota bacterium]